MERSTEVAITRIKIVMLGDSGVGKSTFLVRYVDNKFVVDGSRMTVGVDWKTKMLRVQGKQVQLKIVDTAGQERFSSLAPMYGRNADVILVFYDICSQASFEHVDYWLDKVDLPVQEMEVVLIGNKTDNDIEREVSIGMGQAKAARLVPGGALFFETSAKTKENVDELFEQVICRVLQKYGNWDYTQSSDTITLHEEYSSNERTVNKKGCCLASSATI